MSDAVSFAEVDGQHVEMLAARTVLTTSGPLGNLLGSATGSADGGAAGDTRGHAISQSGDAQNNQLPTGGDGGQSGSSTGGLLTGILSNI